MYRFAIEEIYRQQEHVLDEKGEHLLSLSARLSAAPERSLPGVVDGRRQVPRRDAQHRRDRHDVVRAVPARSWPPIRASRTAGRVPRALRDVRSNRQHVRLAVSRRVPARLVPRPRPRIQDHARCGAARQQYPALGRRHADRDDAGRRRAAAPLSPAAPAGAEARAVLSRTTSRSRSSNGIGGMATTSVLEPIVDVGRAARRRLSGAHAARLSSSAGSTSTRTTASAAARTRRPCTACIRTC